MTQAPMKPPATPQERFDRLLDQRARALAARPAAQDPSARSDMLVCAVGADRYAFALAAVSGVIPAVPTAPALNGPPSLVGLFGRGGLTYSAFDLAAVLGLPASREAGSHLVLMRCPDPLAAFRVDRVLAAMTLVAEPDTAGPAPDADAPVIGYARAVPETRPGDDSGDGLVAVLDADRLFRLLTSTLADGA
jgi:chemotaxis signal transduction protein